MTLPVVAIDYDLGAAGPMEIIRAARGVCEPLFVIDRASPTAPKCFRCSSAAPRFATSPGSTTTRPPPWSLGTRRPA
jgi:hypothetical protein